MKHKKRNYDEVNYWEAMADNMTALLLFILLVLLLLILYLVRIPEEIHQDDHAYESTAAEETKDDNDDRGDPYDDVERHDDTDDGGGSGGGGGNDGSGEKTNHDSKKGNMKSAVFVQLEDEETKKIVKVSGVTFELYYHNALKLLNTYYPEKIEYKEYSTTDEGNFYLPEKVACTRYTLQNLTGIKGYYIPEKTTFDIDKSYDWNNPFVVKIPLSPEKNIIRMQLRDSVTDRSVSGASFEVIAAEDVTTMDGTVRYAKGEKVDTILLDENGYGESIKLYLGKYELKQKTIPKYYAKITNPVPVKVVRQKEKEDVVQTLKEDLTTVTITLRDELYDTQPIGDAKFQIKEGKKTTTYQTDSNGQIILKNLEKNTKYIILQQTSGEQYTWSSEKKEYTVSADGLIDNESSKEILIKNRKIRMTVHLKDKLYQSDLSDISVALQSEQGEIMDNWTANGLERTIEGLKPGTYELIINGKKQSTCIVHLEDTAKMQQFSYNYWTQADTMTIIVAVAVATILIMIAVLLIRKRKVDKRNDMEGREA